MKFLNILFVGSLVVVLDLISTAEGDAATCYTCTAMSSNKKCLDKKNKATCGTGDYGCQTIAKVLSDGTQSITKGCVSLSVCNEAVQTYEGGCTGLTTAGSLCYYCCDSDNCNKCIENDCGGSHEKSSKECKTSSKSKKSKKGSKECDSGTGTIVAGVWSLLISLLAAVM